MLHIQYIFLFRVTAEIWHTYWRASELHTTYNFHHDAYPGATFQRLKRLSKSSLQHAHPKIPSHCLAPYNIATLYLTFFASKESIPCRHSTSLETRATYFPTELLPSRCLTTVWPFLINNRWNEYVKLISTMCTDNATSSVIYKPVAVLSRNICTYQTKYWPSTASTSFKTIFPFYFSSLRASVYPEHLRNLKQSFDSSLPGSQRYYSAVAEPICYPWCRFLLSQHLHNAWFI